MQSSGIRQSLLLENRQLWSLGAVVMIRSIGFGATWPYMAIFFNRQLGVPGDYVGLIFAALAILSTFCQILGGHLTDFWGRKTTMLLGSGLGVLIYMGIIITLLLSSNVTVLVVLFIATAFSGGFLFPAATSAVADITTGVQREQGYAIYRVMANIGWAVGPLIGSQIFDSGIIWIFGVVEITLLIQFALITFLLRETRDIVKEEVPHRRGFADFIVFDVALLVFSAGTFLLMILTSQFSVTIPLFATVKVGLASKPIGYIFAVNGLVVVAGQFPITSLVRRMRREIDGVLIGIACYLVGYLLVGLSSNLIELMFDMVIITIGENFTTPTISSIISRIASGDKLGRYMAFNGIARSVGRATGPAVGAFILYIPFISNIGIWLALDMFGIVSLAIMLAIRQTRLVEREHRELRI